MENNKANGIKFDCHNKAIEIEEINDWACSRTAVRGASLLLFGDKRSCQEASRVFCNSHQESALFI